MTAPNDSEIKGNIQENPFAEILAETSQAGLSGSFRFSSLDKKAIVYLHEGKIVFAVSNLRQHRLFQMLLDNGTIGKEALAGVDNFTNDFALAENLVREKIIDKAAAESFFAAQTEEIIKEVLRWKTGSWTFSYLARAKETTRFSIDTARIVLDFARSKSDEEINHRFKSMEETFAVKKTYPLHINLEPAEGYILSRLNSVPVKLQDIRDHSGLPESLTYKTLYALWLAGFIKRHHWNSFFTEKQIREILSAKISLKTPLAQPVSKVEEVKAEVKAEIAVPVAEDVVPAVSEEVLLGEYLDRVEAAESYYEILDVSITALLPEIKASYFKLAKSYHPDKFHHDEDTEKLQRVQNAFTELARAYETLKDDKLRETYDFKLRKYLDSVKEQRKNTAADEKGQKVQPDRAKMEFDQGFDLIMSEQYESAAPYLARAIQLAPDNARYHAYYGKALSFEQNQRFKAEAEFREAMKLDPENPSYRIMLVEFYIHFNLLKRAEGELQRMMTAFPGNKEAQVLLDSLPK